MKSNLVASEIEFKGERIAEEINKYIKDEKAKIKEYEYIVIKIFSLKIKTNNQEEKITNVSLDILADEGYEYRKRNKAMKNYSMNNVFQYIKYKEI